MKFLFIVQGEGRGHMTQAITLSAMLSKTGHEIVGVVIGKSKRRKIPDFVEKEFDSKILLVDSPNFETDKKSKQIKLGKTISTNLFRTKVFAKSLKKIHRLYRKTEPDVILNFYDILGGLYFLSYRPKAQHWVIGHQYLTLRKDYLFPRGQVINRYLYLLNTRITAIGASQKLALSFNPRESVDGVNIFPPLIRDQVKKQKSSTEDFVLGYMVNSGYSDEVVTFAQANPELMIRVYWDRKGVTEEQRILSNLTFCPIHEERFLADMAACKGLISTAGFESICEARYLGKPVMVIPVAGQYEQRCNAKEIVQLGIGTEHHEFDFGRFEEFIAQHQAREVEAFQSWEKSGTTLISKLIEESIESIPHNPSLSFS